MADRYLNSEGLSHLIDKLKASISKRVDKSSVVQTLGNSETEVLSQKAVTETITALDTEVTLNSKRITILEKGLLKDSFETDSSIAFSKKVPFDALPYAELETLGGMSYRVNVGTDDAPIYELQHSPVTALGLAGRNLMDGNAFADNFVELANATKDEAEKTVTYKVSQVSGKRFFEFSELDPNSVYTIILYGRNNGETALQTNLLVLYSDESTGSLSFQTAGVESYCVYTTKQGVTPVAIAGTWLQGTITLYYEKCGVFEGELTESDFEPYWRDVFPLPEALLNLNGYGCGIDSGCYNWVEWAIKRYTQRVIEHIFDGSEDWSLQNPNKESAYFRLKLGSLGYVVNDKIICNRYDKYAVSSSNSGVGVRLINSETSNMAMITLRPENAKERTLDEWRGQLSTWYAEGNPLKVVYEISTPIKTDLSNILPDDNLIRVDGNGTVTMENEHRHPVPSKITYMLKGE